MIHNTAARARRLGGNARPVARRPTIVLSRRTLLAFLSSAAGLRMRLNAADSDFWNRKEPPAWTPEEIDLLLRKSPWAKPVTPWYVSLPPPSGHRPWDERPPIANCRPLTPPVVLAPTVP